MESRIERKGNCHKKRHRNDAERDCHGVHGTLLRPEKRGVEKVIGCVVNGPGVAIVPPTTYTRSIQSTRLPHGNIHAGAVGNLKSTSRLEYKPLPLRRFLLFTFLALPSSVLFSRTIFNCRSTEPASVLRR